MKGNGKIVLERKKKKKETVAVIDVGQQRELRVKTIVLILPKEDKSAQEGTH